MSEEAQEEKKKESREEKRIRIQEQKIERLRELRGLDAEEVKGYVYRNITGSQRTALPPVDEVLGDHDLGLLYGAGRYTVTYHLDLDGEKKKMCTERYNIGPEYNELHREYCKQMGKPCHLDTFGSMPMTGKAGFNLMDHLSMDKVQGLLALIAGFKAAFPSQSNAEVFQVMQQSQKDMMQLMQSSAQKPDLTDRLAETALLKLTDQSTQNPMNQFKDQMDLFGSFKDLFGEKEKESEPVGIMEKMFEKALENLPEFIQMFQGDVKQAGAEFKKTQPAAAGALLRNPANQEKAFNVIKQKHGLDVAQKFAEGYGLDPSKFEQPVVEVVRDEPVQKMNETNGVISL